MLTDPARAAPPERPRAPPPPPPASPAPSTARLVAATLAACVLGGVTLWTFVALSFRSDWLGLWRARQFYYAPQAAARRPAYYLHRAAAALWSALALLLLASLFAARAKYERFHRVVGALVVACDAVNIVSGLTALIQEPFADTWSTAFVSVNAGVNALLIAAFVLSLCDRVVPRAWHAWLAFGFALSPLGFLIQMNVFYVGCAVTSSSERRGDVWHAALLTSMLVAAGITAGMYAVYHKWYSTEALLPPADKKQPGAA